MSDQAINLLLIEDNPGDARLIQEILSEGLGGQYDLDVVDRLSSGLTRLAQGGIQLVLLDLSLPDSQGLDTVSQTLAHAPDVSIVVLTGLDDKAIALKAIEVGAQDYLVKGQIDSRLLSRSIQYAIQRRQTAEALREGEERYRTVADFTYDWEYWLAPDGKLRYISPSCERITGYRAEEFFQETSLLESIVHPDDRPYLRHHQSQVDEDKQVDAHEADFRIVRRDGELRWIGHTCQTIRRPDGTHLGRRATNRDITERKRAEEALENSEKRFRALIENGLENISLIDANGNLLWESPAIIRTLGYAQNEFIGENTFKLIHSDDLDRTQQMLARLVREPGSRQFGSFRMRRIDGSWRWVEGIATNMLDEPSVEAIVINYRDVTERKSAENALRESEARYRSLFEDSPISLWEEDFSAVKQQLDDLSRQGVKDFKTFLKDHPEVVAECVGKIKVLDVNNATLKLYRAASKADILDNIGNILNANTYLSIGDELVGIAEGKTAFEKEVIDHTLTGDELFIKLSWVTAPGHEDRLSKVIVSKIDITERKRAEEEVYRRVAELEAVNRVSIAMRTAQTIDELLRCLMDETLAVMDTNTGTILLYDPASNQLVAGIDRGWYGTIPQNPMKPAEGIAGSVFATGKTHVSPEFVSDPLTLETFRQWLPIGWGGACVPIRTANDIIGVLFVSVPLPRTLTPEEAHLLQTIAEIAGNAIHRTRLNEQTITRLEHLTALRAIDMAISSSHDLDYILNVILDQVTKQLRVDAADILLLNSHSNYLEYAAGLGFRKRGIEQSRVKVGQSYAGRAVLEQALVHVAEDSKLGESREILFTGEEFVTYYGVPLITKNGAKGVLEIFHRTQLSPDPEWLSYLEALAGQVAIAIDNAELFEGLQWSNAELSLAYDETIEGWSQALDLRDKETEGHTLRVTEITLSLARLLGFDEKAIVHLRRGALLHDIGKMGIPDRILLKPGPLDPEEWEIMRKHPVYARELLAPIAYLRPALEIPYCHHEKWDGTGYPRGLKGEEIPIEARIFAVVDVWDALNSDRPYRKAWTKGQSIHYIQDEAGKHFDPSIVSIFLRELTGTNEWIKFTSRV